MKFLFKLQLALFLALALSLTGQAQQKQQQQQKKQSSSGSSSGYSTGIGLRAGNSAGLTLKHFIKSDAAIEGILSSSFFYRGMRVTVLYEKHAQAFNAPRLQWFYGVGGHVGSFRGRYYYRHRNNKYYYDYYNDNFLVIGIDGILGLEYFIKDIPFTIGVDIKPFIDLNGNGVFLFGDGAFTVRYVF